VSSAKLKLVPAAALIPALVGVAQLGAQSPQVNSMTIALSTSHAAAHPVAVTLQLHYEMQCGYPGPGPVVVRFPAHERLPKTLPAGAVLADGSAQAATVEGGNAVSVTLPPAPTVMCDVIGPGRLTIVFERSAGLGNPLHAGTYQTTATRESTMLASTFAIRGR
jgi:hypothetical protein